LGRSSQISHPYKDRIARLEELKEQLTPHKEMLASFLENDEKYREATKLAKEASQQKSAVKKHLLSTPQGKNLEEKVITVKEEMKEVEEALSYYLREYQRLTGSNEFEGSDGELRQIVYIAKLVRKTNLNR
jgi:arginine/lysine/ornithine decarboxylase